jgi:hypothetical protein
MTIDPRVSMYLNIALASLMGIGGYLASDSAFMHSGAGVGTVIGIGAAVAAINGVLHAIPSKPGATDQFPLGPSK